jgi:AAA+ ATPase superfamily predicted ATPase
MKFYDREEELEQLRKICELSQKHAQFTVVTGRRRVGKTKLLLEATAGQPMLYFFVSRKAEPELCEIFQREIKDKLGETVIAPDFERLFKFIMEQGTKQPFTLIIDEFQEFLNINPSVYSDLQHYWDVTHTDSQINLFVCGSVYSLMHKIFQSYKEPLFGRATNFFNVHPFRASVLKQILAAHNPQYTPEDLLALFTLTGGVPQYVAILMDNNVLTLQAMVDFMIRENSSFITEGKTLLITEFGKDYGIYFSILSAIARGENTRGKIEACVGKEVDDYLTCLEDDYGLIKKNIPLFSKPETKDARYIVNDEFLRFWFRFIYKYENLTETAQYNELKEIIMRDYPTFSGFSLERYFREKMIEQGGFTRLGSYWDKTGANEIDFIMLHEFKNTAMIAEIKRNEKHIRYNALKEKAEAMMAKTGQLKNYEIEYKGLSMNDM